MCTYICSVDLFYTREATTMSQQISRQIALVSVLATCVLIVTLLVAAGLDANTRTALGQAFPLALVGGVGLAVVLADPFRSR